MREWPRVLADASPLIGLARIGRLDLLTAISTPIYVTRTVWREVAEDASRPGASILLEAEEQGSLCVIESGDDARYPELDAGENSTLSAAAAMGAAVIIDERAARERIENDDVLRAAIGPPLTTIGVVIRAKRHGKLREVRPVLDALRRERFWISDGDYARALHAAGEAL